MYNKKRVSILIVLVVISIIGIGIVSAGWFSDLFKLGKGGEGLEGELEQSRPSTATVEISGTSEPPQIVYVSDVSDPSYIVGLELSETWSFYFLVYSAATESYLPPLPPPNEGKFAKGNVSFGSTNVGDNNCIRGNPALVDGTPYGKPGSMLVNYTCDVTMRYFYSPGVWTINASVEDKGGNKASNSSRTFVLAENEGFRIEPNPAFLNWTSVQLSSNPKSSNNELKIINQGNNDVAPASSPLGARAYRLNGTTIRNEVITADKFGASDVVTCGPAEGDIGTVLSQGSLININPFSVLYSSSTTTTPANNNLTFCLDTITEISVQTYNSTENYWLIEVVWD